MSALFDPVTTASQSPKPRTKAQVHRKVLHLLSEFPSFSSQSKILDVPCGEGALLPDLKGLGFLPHGIDLDHDSKLDFSDAITSWDCNQTPLPHGDGYFDYITSVEGIEHLENPFVFIRELYRMLRPDGCLVLTTPNIISLRSRVRFIGSGFFHKFSLPLNEARPDPSHHITPITFPNLRYMLHCAGFAIEEVTCSYVKAISLPYLILAPWIALYCLLAFRREKDRSQRARNWQTLRWMLSWPVLLGEHLVIVARKT